MNRSMMSHAFRGMALQKGNGLWEMGSGGKAGTGGSWTLRLGLGITRYYPHTLPNVLGF